MNRKVTIDGVELHEVDEEHWSETISKLNYTNTERGGRLLSWVYKRGDKPPYDGGPPAQLVGAVDYTEPKSYYLSDLERLLA